MNRGVFCISWDTELLWGRKDLNWQDFVPRVEKERQVIEKILAILKKYNIATTWAIVGKVYEKGNKNWHGPDIVRMIKSIKNQEIGSHSYSHEIFDQIDIKTAKKEMINPNRLKSFIFPRNRVRYLEILKKNKYITYRGKDVAENELLMPTIPPVFEPTPESGLVNVRGSMYFVSGRGLRRFIPLGLRYLKCRMGIDRAVNEKKVFHVWAHPTDLCDDTAKLLTELEWIARYANKKRAEGKLDILTMAEVAKAARRSRPVFDLGI